MSYVMGSSDGDVVGAVADRFGLRFRVAYAGPVAQAARCQAIDALANRLADGHDVRLVCVCAPRRCHGHGLAKIIEQRATERRRAARVGRKRKRGRAGDAREEGAEGAASAVAP